MFMVISKKRAAIFCVLPGVLLASVFLSSSKIFDNKPFELLPEAFSDFMIVVITMCGTVHFLKALLMRLFHFKD